MKQGKWFLISFSGIVISVSLCGYCDNPWFFLFTLYSIMIGNVYSEECNIMEQQNKEEMMDSGNKTFTLTDEQTKKFNEWRKVKNDKIRATGELPNNTYTYSFTPTGIGLGLVIDCSDGTKLDLTEYEKW